MKNQTTPLPKKEKKQKGVYWEMIQRACLFTSYADSHDQQKAPETHFADVHVKQREKHSPRLTNFQYRS